MTDLMRYGRRVYTGGTFDILHRGHMNLLRQCRKLAGPNGTVVVGLNNDAFIERYKKRPPMLCYEDRAAVLEACRYVDEVVDNVGDEDSKVVLEQVCPDYVVIGTDWAKRDYYAQMQFTQAWLDERDISLVYVPYTEGICSTDVRERIRATAPGTVLAPVGAR
ncbi:MAG: adenylyltransferase/cytidyltransferase family protein [Planctomycetota bacterium]